MSNRIIEVPLTEDGINEAINELKRYTHWLQHCTNRFITELANRGLEVSQAGFERAVYDGTNDVSVSVQNNGKYSKAVVAIGGAVLFIEFGSGIVYADNHPEAAENGMIRGGYGYHLGQHQTWRYPAYKGTGTNGELITEGKHKGQIRTHGNPANMAMYNAVKDLEQNIHEIAERCFTDD